MKAFAQQQRDVIAPAEFSANANRMPALGHHALLDLYDCDGATLDDRAHLQQVFHDTAIALRCTIIDESFHQFTPQGVSGVVVLAESHLSLHTWPEHGYAAVDLYTCGDPASLDRMPEILKRELKAGRYEFKKLARGFIATDAKKAAS